MAKSIMPRTAALFRASKWIHEKRVRSRAFDHQVHWLAEMRCLSSITLNSSRVGSLISERLWRMVREPVDSFTMAEEMEKAFPCLDKESE